MPDPAPINLDNLFNESFAQAQQEGGQHDPPPGQPEPTPPAPQQSQSPQPSGQSPQHSPQQPPPQQDQPQDPPSRATLDALAARGYDVSGFSSDDEWFEVADQAEAQRQFVDQELRAWNENRDAFYEWQRKQREGHVEGQPGQLAQQPAQPTQPEPEKPKWQPPQASPLAREWAQRGYIPLDPKTGRYKATDPSLVKFEQELNAEVDWQREKARMVLTNPDAWFEETGLAEKYRFNKDEFLSEVDRRVQETLEARERERIAQYQEQQIRSQFEQIVPFLYQVNQNGIATNAAGEWIPTPIGQKFEAALQQLQARGIQDRQQLTQLAIWHVSGDLQAAIQQAQGGNIPGPTPSNPSGQPAPHQQPPQTPQQKREENQETWLQRTNGKGKNRLSQEDATILEAARKTNPGNAQGFQRVDDVWDAAYNETLREG